MDMRALRAYFLESATIMPNVLQSSHCFTMVHHAYFQALHESLYNSDYIPLLLFYMEPEESVQQLLKTIDELITDAATQSRTPKLLAEYLKQVSNIRHMLVHSEHISSCQLLWMYLRHT